MTNINHQALYTACFRGDAAAVSRLLPAGGTPRNLSGPSFQSHNNKSTPLIAAAQGGHTEIVRLMLKRARNTTVDHTNAHGDTAQLLSAQYHHVNILGVLADHGANVNLADRQGNTALCLAVAPIPADERPRDPDPHGARQLATVKALLQLDAAPDPVDDSGETPLCVACEFSPAKVAVALLDGDADIDFATPASCGNIPGCTPLMFAVGGVNAGVVKLLLKRGADGTRRTTQAAHGLDKGSTALHMARLCAGGNPDCVEIFTVLRKRCCSACGMTSLGLASKTAGEKKHLKRCGNCPARGSRARYSGEICQRADWVSRHRAECAESRRARQAAATQV